MNFKQQNICILVGGLLILTGTVVQSLPIAAGVTLAAKALSKAGTNIKVVK